MDQQADIRLVDAHAKGDGRDDDRKLVANEAFLRRAPNVAVEAGMVRPSLVAAFTQPGRNTLCITTRSAVDDGGLALVLEEQLRQSLE